MANLAVDLEEAAASVGATITHATLGVHHRHMWDKASDDAPLGRVLPWADARPFLDEEYDNGFGGADCRPFVAWSPNWVFWVHEYDGATCIEMAPCAPTPCTPDFNGVEP